MLPLVHAGGSWREPAAVLFDGRGSWGSGAAARVAPGSYANCLLCHREDDIVQLRWPTVTGANEVSLIEAQLNTRRFGACDQRGLRFTRQPAADEPLDPVWRPIDPQHDSFEDPDAQQLRPWPDDPAVLCWWLPSFWGRGGLR